jgi:ATP-dependent RNA helicase RhlE
VTQLLAQPDSGSALSHPSTATRRTSFDSFEELGLCPELLRAVAAEGYERPTPIQQRAIAPVLEGRDLLGCAQTGTGKTAAFVLPILQRLARGTRTGKIRALIIAPTRELAAQIEERVTAYGRHVGLRHAVIYGGVGQRAQEDALRQRPDILVATPGRLLDLMEQRYVRLDGVEIFVLDEADRMLDMGFINDVKRVVAAVPKDRQTLLFSATIPSEIARLVSSVLRDPVRIDIAPDVTTAERVDHCVYFVARADKRALLERLLREEGAQRSIVFTRTKHGANRLAEQLDRSGIVALAIHGNKSQGARERALEGFKVGSVAVLVATDLAARGIDVDGISHVFNYDLPNVPESYVHRIGRTGRAGASGRAIAFCDPEERPLLRDIERFVKKPIPVAGSIAASPVEPGNGSPNGGRGAAPFERSGSYPNGRGRDNRPNRAPGHRPDAGARPSESRSATGAAQPARAPERRPGNDVALPPQPKVPMMPGESTRNHRSRRFRGARLY